MGITTVRDLIRAGVHFGHRTSRWNPKMAPYIFKKRNLIHIIDLKKTILGLLTARRVAAAIARKGEYVLFVGTKRQARPIMRREAERCGMPYVTERWPGGMLTNYVTIRKRLERLEELEELERTGRINEYSKKMVSSLRRERRKIERNLGGVREMNDLPGLLAIVDPEREDIVVREAVKLEIPTIAWMDTDADPDDIDVVIPANDDAIGSIEIFAKNIADAVLDGRERAEMGEQQRKTPEPRRTPTPKPDAEQGSPAGETARESKSAETAGTEKTDTAEDGDDDTATAETAAEEEAATE